jgi:hypothetical protein
MESVILLLSRARLPIPPQGLSDIGRKVDKGLTSRSRRNMAGAPCRSTRVLQGPAEALGRPKTLQCDRARLDSAGPIGIRRFEALYSF